MGEATASPCQPANTSVAVVIERGAWESADDVHGLCKAAVAAAAAEVQPTAPFAINVLLSDNDRLRELNARYRNKNVPTNVLAFPCGDDPLPSPARGPCVIGDIALAFQTLATEAGQQDKTIPDHLSHLVVHGTLHLLGYDHHTDNEATIMEEIERRALNRLGIADPYVAASEHDE